MTAKAGSTVLRDARRIVVKVGSSLVTNEGRGLDEAAIGEWCRQLALLVRGGREVVMVSSGANAEGMKGLGAPAIHSKVGLRDPMMEDCFTHELISGMLKSGAKQHIHLQDEEMLVRHLGNGVEKCLQGLA